MEIKDHIASPVIYVCCENVSSQTIEIPECYLQNNYMYYPYFRFTSYMAFYDENIVPKYTGQYKVVSDDEKEKKVYIKPNEKIRIEYSLLNFYSIPDDMYSTQFIQYDGPLGYCDQRFVYFEGYCNKKDFDIQLEIKKEKNNLIAELTYYYKQNEPKYFKNNYFVDTNNLGGTVFDLEINGKKIEYSGIMGDDFGVKSYIKDLRLCKKNDVIKTKVNLNKFYDIDSIKKIESYKITFKGHLGSSNTVVK